MDPSSSGILGLVAIIVSVGGSILAVINHTRVRSTCCGKTGEVSLDISQTTPPVRVALKLPSPDHPDQVAPESVSESSDQEKPA